MHFCVLKTSVRGLGVQSKCNSTTVRNYVMPAAHTLYGDVASPPVRFVMMTASFLQIKLQYHNIDLFMAENKTDSYTKINPLQKVPALVFGKEIICDSHAIAVYLCQWKSDQDLYPINSSIAKAKVDEMLFYNSSTLFPVDSAIFTGFFAGKWPVSETHINQWHAVLNYLEYRLSQFEWLSGDKILLSDICCAATVTSLEILLPVPEKYTKVRKWLKRLEKMPLFKINKQGINRLRLQIKSIGPQML